MRHFQRYDDIRVRHVLAELRFERCWIDMTEEAMDEAAAIMATDPRSAAEILMASENMTEPAYLDGRELRGLEAFIREAFRSPEEHDDDAHQRLATRNKIRRR